MKAKFLLFIFMLFAAKGAMAQGTAFTYQGRLNDGGSPANGQYDFRFKLFTDPDGNFQTGLTLLTNSLALSNGLFAATLDFGPGLFNGSNYWLEIGVRTNGGGSYTSLDPLQSIRPAPYAMFANSASNLMGTISPANLSGYSGSVTFSNVGNSFGGTFAGNGANVSNVNAVALNGLGATNFWQTGGNAGTGPTNFIGTTDNQPLELRVNGQRAFRLLPDTSTNNAPDVVGGAPTNTVSAGPVGVTIGGGALNAVGPPALFGGVNPYGDLRIYTNLGASFATIAGGFLNEIQSNATFSTIGGGAVNTILAANIESTIAGGFNNTILSNAPWSFIGGGTYHSIGSFNGFIGGGWTNTIQTNASYSSIVGGYFNQIQSSGGGAVIGGGYANTIGSDGLGFGGNYSVIGGGYLNSVDENDSVVGGGQQNFIQPLADHSVIGGGSLNQIAGSLSLTVAGVIGGGQQNLIQTNASYGVIPGGYHNVVGGTGSFAAGVGAQATNSGTFVWSDGSTNSAFNSTSSNQFLVRAAGGVGIGTNNPAAALHVAGTNAASIAMRISSGGIAVSGAGIGTPTAAFIQLTAAANVIGDSSYISNPLCNDDPNALLFVTHVYNPPGAGFAYFNKNFGVWYTGSQWAIYVEDGTQMPINVAFNVLVIKP